MAEIAAADVAWVNCFQALRSAIEAGELGPGVRLVERELCSRFGVSRPTLRTALHFLAAEGLVQLIPRRGATVTKLTVEQALDILDVREPLEGVAAALAAKRASEEQIRMLEGLVVQMKTAIESGDYLTYSKVTKAFHEAVMGMAGNEYLRAAIDAARVRLISYDWAVLMSGHINALFKGHVDVLDAIRKGDAEAAEWFAREHIRVVRSALCEGTSPEGSMPRLRPKCIPIGPDVG